jgi:hypothetical protein
LAANEVVPQGVKDLWLFKRLILVVAVQAQL